MTSTSSMARLAPLRRIVAFRHVWVPPWAKRAPLKQVLLPVLECGHVARWSTPPSLGHRRCFKCAKHSLTT